MTLNFAEAHRRWVGVLALVAGVCACGGGGAASPATTPTPVLLPAVNIVSVAAADPGSSLAAGWEYGAVMEIFVRSYQDSDGDGIGDLRGLISRLDYLRDLGIKGIWLMPVTASQDGDHGYAVTDYRDIEKAYGSLTDFDELLKQAHARGIGVLIDYVINHSAALNPLFIHSRAATDNTFRSWYVWQDPAPTGWSIYGGNPWRYWVNGAYFAGFDTGMPDFNLLNPAVVAYHQDNLRFWMNRGVDGFRFDAVGNLVENGPSAWDKQPQDYTIMGQMRSVTLAYQRRTMVCEGPADSRGFAADTACGSAFAFDLNGNLIAAAKGNASAAQAVSDYFKTAPANMSTFLSNHDAFAGQRVWDQLAGNVAQYKLAAAALLLLPGRPYIYYGEEVGMGGALSLADDGRLRTPMSWSADATAAGFSTVKPYRVLSSNAATQNVALVAADANGLLAHYKALLALRNGLPSVAQGSYVAPFASGTALGFQRVLGNERTLVLFNFGSAEAALDVTSLPASATLQSAYPAAGAGASATAAGTARITLPAQSLRVFKVLP